MYSLKSYPKWKNCSLCLLETSFPTAPHADAHCPFPSRPSSSTTSIPGRASSHTPAGGISSPFSDRLPCNWWKKMWGIMEEEEKGKRKAPSLVDLCVDLAISNVRYLGDVGETDSDLLGRILPHCTVDQLQHIENCTVGRDLSPITDKLWKGFFVKQFGQKSADIIIERMRRKKVSFRWKQLYEAKLKDIAEVEGKVGARIRELYKKEDARKQSRQVQICTKVPPSSKRSFYGGSGPGYNLSNVKSNLMKKAKLDFLNSRERKNLAALRKNAVQRNNSSSSSVKPVGVQGRSSALSSTHMKPLQRRF